MKPRTRPQITAEEEAEIVIANYRAQIRIADEHVSQEEKKRKQAARTGNQAEAKQHEAAIRFWKSHGDKYARKAGNLEVQQTIDTASWSSY